MLSCCRYHRKMGSNSCRNNLIVKKTENQNNNRRQTNRSNSKARQKNNSQLIISQNLQTHLKQILSAALYLTKPIANQK